MPTTRTNASLRIVKRVDPGSGASAAVTEALGITPSRSHEAGDPRSSRNPSPWPHSFWGLESALPKDRSLDEHLAALCDVVEPVAAALDELVEDGYELDWFCFIDVQGGQGGTELGPQLLRRLADLPAALSLDIYADANED